MPDLTRTVAAGDEIPTALTRLQRSFLPAILLFTCLRELIRTVLQDPLAMRDWPKFRHHAFANFWLKYGAQLSVDLPSKVLELIHSASGLVLDVGPGDGSLVHLFDADKIDMVYGPEPAVDLHPTLVAKAKAAGLGGKYEPLACGAEPQSLVPALSKVGLIKSEGGVADGVFDTIMCTRVLCGIPQPEETAKQLFRLLKPGGRMIVYEHIVSPWPKNGAFLGWLMQTLYWALGWNLWMGGCEINRDTTRTLKEAGGASGWKDIDLRCIDAWHPIPFVIGVLQKA